MNIVEPYVSAGPFKFGASLNDIVSVLGPPVSQQSKKGDETVVRYEGIRATISSRGVLEVSFLPEVNVSLLGIDVFGNPEAFRKLCELDGAPKEFVGFIVLFKLGVAMTGFHDGDDAQKALTVFEKGHWDQFASELKDYAFL